MKATLHLMVGLPGSGKTTYAKQLEADRSAVRFTPDEWQIKLFGDDTDHSEHDARHTAVEEIMWEYAQKLLKQNVSVIMDFGFWSAEERLGLCKAAKAMQVDFEVHFMDVPKDELLRRVQLRNQREDEISFTIQPHHMEEWYTVFEPVTAYERHQYNEILYSAE